MKPLARSLAITALFCAFAVGGATGQSLRQRLDELSPADRQWVEDACAPARSLGPSPYVDCAERQLKGLAKLGASSPTAAAESRRPPTTTRKDSPSKTDSASLAECLDGATLLSKDGRSLREQPESSAKVTRKLLGQAELVVLEPSDVSGWCRVVDTTSGEIGWIQLSHATATNRPIISRSRDVFSVASTNDGRKPTVEIRNDADRSIALEVAGKLLKIESKQTSNMDIEPGSYSFHATAARARPLLGTQKFENGSRYTWTFWIGGKK